MKLSAIVGLLYMTIGSYLYRRNKRTLLLISPIATMISFTFDVLGNHFNFWRMRPFRDRDLFHSLPIHLGLYPLLASLLVHALQRTKQCLWLITGAAIITTILEALFVRTKNVRYYHFWTIGWTFLSYQVAYILVYLYYRYLKREQILP